MFSDNLKKIIKVETCLDLKTICEHADISQATLYAILGRRDNLNPRLNTLTAIANSLGIPLYLLFRPTTEKEWQEIFIMTKRINSKK